MPLARQRAQLAHEAVVEHAHAALALHRLEDQRRDRLGVEHDREVLEVALDDRHAARERAERRAVARPIGRRERREQAAVECAAQRDDVGLRGANGRPRPPPRELERALVRFRARVAEEHLVRERQLDEARRELLARRRAEQVRDVNQAIGRGVHAPRAALGRRSLTR